MTLKVVFKCANDKCNAMVDTDRLNVVRLKIIRRIAILCKRCNQRTMWSETSVMFDEETKTVIDNGGSTNEIKTKSAH